jgi:uncharacterized protein DUF6484
MRVVDVELEVAAGDTRPAVEAPKINGVVIATLIGFADEDRSPLVVYPDQRGTAAIAARTTIDLFGSHIGSQVVLMFENGDPGRPIVIGRLRDTNHVPKQQGNRVIVDVEADGERTIVSAKEQLVLQCGKASITLTRSGKVLLSGTYVLSHSTGTNRIKGGTVQLN